MNTKQQTKQAKKQLQNRDYVARLTSLTPIEREILSAKYRTFHYQAFGFKRNAKSLEELERNVQHMLQQMRQFASAPNKRFVRTYRSYRHDKVIGIHTADVLTDKQLIKRHLKALDAQKASEQRRQRILAGDRKMQAQKLERYLASLSKKEAAKILKLAQKKVGK